MRSFETRSNDIDKKLCSLRELASVSSVETKSVVSDWPLPKVTGSASSSSTGRPAPARVLDFPSLLGKDKSLLSHRHRRRSQNGTNKTTSSFAVLFLSGSLVVRTRTLSKNIFARSPFPGVEDYYEIKWKKGSDSARLVFFSHAASVLFFNPSSVSAVPCSELG